MTADSGARVNLSVVIPCLDEEAGVGAVVDAAWAGISASGRTGEVIVVDNDSTDRSAEIAEQHGARVVHEPRRGYGSAYLAGLDEARGDLIVMADADGTYDLSALGPFVGAYEEGADLVLGSRLRGTIHPGAMPWSHRWIGNPILTGVLNLFFHTGVSDAHCGMRAVRRSALPILRLQATGMEFASEMILKAAKRDLRIAEVPIDYYPRAGTSKLSSFRDAWRHLRFMLVHASTFLFVLPGTVLLALGLAVLFALAGGPVEAFGRSWEIHAMIVASVAAMIGLQVVLLGIFARTYAALYLGEREPLLERAWRRIRLEHGLLLGGAVLLAGLGLLTVIFVGWASDGFGPLASEHESLLGLTLVALGVQIVFGSFFLAVLGLQKHLLLEREVPEPRLAPERELSSRHR